MSGPRKRTLTRSPRARARAGRRSCGSGRAACPTPSATWWVGPCAHHVSMNSAGPFAKRIREFVLPIRKVGPAIDSPSAASSFSRPSAVCERPRIVTGPSLTLNSTESPAPALPWKSLSARSTGRSSEIATCPGPSWPIRTKLLVEVERVELGVRAARAEAVEQEHRDVRLQVALARGRDPAGGEQRVADDQAGAVPARSCCRPRRGSSRSARRARSPRRAGRARRRRGRPSRSARA